MKLRIKLMIRIFVVAAVYCVMTANTQLVTNASVYNLEKLTGIKDVLNPTNLPVLKRYFYSYRGSDITGPAIAQALFIIDTPESLEILRKGMYNIPKYDFGYSISLAHHWQLLSQKDIYRFVMDYHLTNIPNGITISLDVRKLQATNTQYEFIITRKNTTTNFIRIRDSAPYHSKHLIFISPDKHVMHLAQTGAVFRKPRSYNEVYPVILPGDTFEMKITGIAIEKGNDFMKKFRMDRHFNFMCYDHNLTVPGKYTVYAYYTLNSEYYLHEMLRQKYPKQDNFDPEPKLWYGMAVSDPVEIEIPLTTKQKKLI